MLAGSLGPQLAQNLYKLIATPHTDGISSDFPQQVSTWEEYYSYLHTRYQQGTLGKDSIGLMQIAQNNSGRIVENQQHHAPIVVGLSLSKKLNERWSLETGLQYTLLRSEFTTGEAFRIQDNQKLHYIGIPLRLSYRFWHYKRFSGYATAGMQVDIHQAGAYEQALGIDDLAAFGNGGGAHFAKIGDEAVFDEQNRIGDQMITHDQCCMDNCLHAFTSPLTNTFFTSIQ